MNLKAKKGKSVPINEFVFQIWQHSLEVKLQKGKHDIIHLLFLL